MLCELYNHFKIQIFSEQYSRSYFHYFVLYIIEPVMYTYLVILAPVELILQLLYTLIYFTQSQYHYALKLSDTLSIFQEL